MWISVISMACLKVVYSLLHYIVAVISPSEPIYTEHLNPYAAGG